MVAVLSIKQAEVFFKSILYMLKGMKGEVPKTDKFSRRALSFVMCFLQKAERKETERETNVNNFNRSQHLYAYVRCFATCWAQKMYTT